jgi:hypothetical protein
LLGGFASHYTNVLETKNYWIKSDILYEQNGDTPNAREKLRANMPFRAILANTPGFEGLRPNKNGFSIKFLPSSP